MIQPKLIALGTIELFALEGDTPNDVKIKLVADVGLGDHPEITEHLTNVQFGIFYDFLNNEDKLANKGKIFRAGMSFGNKATAHRRDPDDEDKPQFLTDLEALLKDKKKLN
jgi:hypothetical protein